MIDLPNIKREHAKESEGASSTGFSWRVPLAVQHLEPHLHWCDARPGAAKLFVQF